MRLSSFEHRRYMRLFAVECLFFKMNLFFFCHKESESVLQNRISGLSSASSMSEVADLLSNLNARVASLTQWQEGTQQAITRYDCLSSKKNGFLESLKFPIDPYVWYFEVVKTE